MTICACVQVGNLKGESGGAVATQQHLQRRRKNLLKVLDHVKVTYMPFLHFRFSALPFQVPSDSRSSTPAASGPGW